MAVKLVRCQAVGSLAEALTMTPVEMAGVLKIVAQQLDLEEEEMERRRAEGDTSGGGSDDAEE